jgi:hypothetical protein
MAVNLSPVGGVAAQFFTNTGAVLTGGKLYTYAAGTTTPATTFTSSQGITAWTNPIVLDAAGRVSGSGEIWLTDGVNYKFVLKDSNDVLIATYDNVSGINSNFISFTNSQQIITATANQTVFNLSISYQPGTNSLSVFVDGVNQYGPGAQYAYVETDSDTVTFVSGLHVGAEVKFTTTQQQGAGVTNASQVTYNPSGTGAVATNVQAKLRESISVTDFGAVGNGTTDDTTAIQNANNAAAAQEKSVFFPGTSAYYKITTSLTQTASWIGEFSGIPYQNDTPVKIIKTNGVTNGVSVINVGAANLLTAFITVAVLNPPEYYDVTYPTGAPYDATNPDYGFNGTGHEGLQYFNCSAWGFRVAGFYLGAGSVLSSIDSCSAKWNNCGFRLATTDSEIINSCADHNCGTGVEFNATYLRAINNRIEWNATSGMWVQGGEFVIVGNLFDRNGQAGLHLGNGAWGGTVTGNYFSRNGASGDGVNGRWGFSVPGNPSYALITPAESCHIRVTYQRDVTITANRYRAGQDDAGGGVLSPAYIYRNDGANDKIFIRANAGEYAFTAGYGGYNSAYPGGSGVFSGGEMYERTSGELSSTSGTIGLPHGPAPSFGEITVQWAQSPNNGVAKVTYWYDATFGAQYAVTNLIGTASSLTVSVTSTGIVIGGYTFLRVYQIGNN